MNPDDYCQQKAAPPGSTVYYALRQAPLARRPLLTALYALRQELADAVREVSDLSIGHAKLGWWQNEIAQLRGGNPSHPVTQSLARHLAAPPGYYEALAQLAQAFDMDLEQTRYLDFAGLQHYLERTGGAFAALAAGANAQPPEIGTAWAAGLGRGLALAELVQDVGDDARHGRIYIPIDEMQRFGVTAAALVNRQYSDAFTALMRFQAARARATLSDALAAMPAGERRRQPTLRAQAAIALASLDEIEADEFQILHQRIALTPLRKLWVAWRAARRR